MRSRGRFLAAFLFLVTLALVILGTLWPSRAAIALSGAPMASLGASSSPEAAVRNLLGVVARRDWKRAYADLGNRGEFSEQEFENDLAGSQGSLRTYATLSSFEVRPLHATADDAKIKTILHWATVVGGFDDARVLAVRRSGDSWQVSWPLARETRIPPQVIPVNYLRWDVIYRGPNDDWGAQDVDGPRVRIIDMHPIERADGIVILGELLNEDVVPAYVEVKATLLRSDGSALATEDSFDEIVHVLLPKQVTPFRINFPGRRLSQVDSIRMQPSANLVAASADPMIAIEDQHLAGGAEAELAGSLVNQSGQIVNIAHVVGTFYDKTGQVVWVDDGYANRALLPQTPVPFAIALPSDLSAKISSYRVVTSSYTADRL